MLFSILKYIPDSGLSRFFLGVFTGHHAWTPRWQVENTSAAAELAELRKITIFNEHSVALCYLMCGNTINVRRVVSTIPKFAYRLEISTNNYSLL